MRSVSIVKTVLAVLLVGSLGFSILTGCARPETPVTNGQQTEAPEPEATEEPAVANVAVAIAPVTGPAGTEVAVAVAGFPGETDVELGVGQDESGYEVVDSSRTDSAGTLATSLHIPTTADPGQQWFVVAESADGTVGGASDAFVVREVEYEPDVFVVPGEGAPGTEVEVVAHGFPSDATVEIGIGRVDSEYDVVETARTDGAGRMAAAITIPSFVEPAHRWVIVVADQERRIRAISEEFEVLEPTTPTPPPEGAFTRTNIYLVAVADDGQFGERFGCDDSLVKYEVAIEPTMAPLTAALEELLSIDSRQVGEMELTNHPLYRSELEIDSVEIVDGEAVIRLSGTLDIAGVCDEPRVWMQLSETALQYETVDEVSIFIDDTPLDELLMMDIE